MPFYLLYQTIPSTSATATRRSVARSHEPVPHHHDEELHQIDPHAITESAKIDGAGDFTIFLRLILPMATPALGDHRPSSRSAIGTKWYNAMLEFSRRT